MDNKGFISVEYIFSLFIIIIIASGMLFYGESIVNASFNIEDSISHRMILDSVAGKISQVNSNGAGYSKYVELPSDKGYFEIVPYNDDIIVCYDCEEDKFKNVVDIVSRISDKKIKRLCFGNYSYAQRINEKFLQ